MKYNDMHMYGLTPPGPGNGPHLPSIWFYAQYAYKARVAGGAEASLEDAAAPSAASTTGDARTIYGQQSIRAIR